MQFFGQEPIFFGNCPILFVTTMTGHQKDNIFCWILCTAVHKKMVLGQKQHFWTSKRPLWAIGATKRPARRPNGHLPENWRYPELPQDMGDLWSHCTMALSIEIEDFQVLKSKCLVFAQFWSKSNKSFSDWCTTVNILVEKYFLYDKYLAFFWQNVKGWTDRPEIFHEDKRGQS